MESILVYNSGWGGGQPKMYSGNKSNKFVGHQPQGGKKQIYMAITKPAYRSVGLQERKVGGKKKKPKQNSQS